MVRFTVLTCVLGMAAFCLAVIIQPSISYAYSNSCPCWPGGLSQLEDQIGSPAATDLSRCDTILQTDDSRGLGEHIGEIRWTSIYASDTSLIAWAALEGSPQFRRCWLTGLQI
jgi:hypothetical protein